MEASLPLRVFCLAAFAVPALAATVHGQSFGRNKVQYDSVDFRVLTTPHFDVYHAREDAVAARMAAELAERWHGRLSRVFDHQLSGRQPVILYGSHRGFEQTNVTMSLIDESTGGFTESRKRRIVLPFGASLGATEHVLAHELVHAFQYDIAAKHRTTINLPLWLIEGMAEYLSLGPDDPLTAMWMRDATRQEELPAIRDLHARRHFPYRWGAALWSYLHRRFGDGLPGRILKTRGSALQRLETVTGVPAAQLSDEWHVALRQTHAPAAGEAGASDCGDAVISRSRSGGRLNLGASLSPDGRHVVFLSEKDQLSIDVFLADARTGVVSRKLLTTAATTAFESLQYLHSSGAWDPTGRYFALATVRQGRPALTILDVQRTRDARTIPIEDLGEAFGPTWSPDGRAIAFSGMRGGVSDLYVVDLETATVRQLTDDPYADLQPAWSPDGRTIAFVTERFTTDLATLSFGPYAIGLFDLASGDVRPAPQLAHTRHINPVWSADGSSLFVVADHDGVGNVFRLRPDEGRFFRITDVATGVGGLTRLSPALSVARHTGALSYTVYRNSAYEIHVIDSPEQLAGAAVDSGPPPGVPAPVRGGAVATARMAADPGGASPRPRFASGVDPSPASPGGAAARTDQSADTFRTSRYRSTLSLEAMGQPYFSAGGGPFGNHIRGGMSLLFGDLLGNRQLFTSLDVSSRLGESAVQALYIDRQSRWNWGAAIDQVPEIWMRRWQDVRESGDRIALTREQERRTHRRLAGFVAYPFDRSTRLELNAAIRNISFHTEAATRVFARPSGRLEEETRETLPSPPSLTLGEAGVALVRDTAVFGATGPILGTRYRIQVAPAFGELSFTQLLVDYRRYVMPVRPFTLAFRVLHSARYGTDGDDPRLREAFLGSASLVRGYGAGSVARSACRDTRTECLALERLIGSRLLAGKVELRFPLLGALSSRIRYGPLPVDAVVFADAGTIWGGRAAGAAGDAGRAALRSAGAGARVNAAGIILEFDVVRPFDLAGRGWTFGFNVRPGF